VLPLSEPGEPRIERRLTFTVIIRVKVKHAPRVALETAGNSRGLRRKWS
jgi:hypothetical protein